MRHVPPVATIGAAALMLAAPVLLIAFKEGPAPAMTGGFGEPTCRKCHFDNRPNAAGGALRVLGVPAAYTPGKTYAITVILRRANVTRAGFEMSARFAPGGSARAGKQAGRFTAPDARLQIVFEPGKTVEYIQHTKLGSLTATAGEGRWTFQWTAPTTTPGPVSFHVAANATNDDASPLGDYIYTTMLTSRAAR